MTARTTLARRAIWNAIDAYPALNPGGISVFHRRIRHEGATGMLDSVVPAGLGDLPAIEIIPSEQDYQQLTNRMAEFPYAVDVRLTGMYLDRLEAYSQDIVLAVFQQGPVENPTVPFIKGATGYHPQAVRVSSPQIVSLGKGKSPQAWRMVLTLALKFQYDPFGS